MAAFYANETTVSTLDDSIVLAYAQSFLIGAGQDQNMDSLATIEENIGAKSIQISKYPRMTPVTSSLTETDDPASVALTDSSIVLTPAEYGNVASVTNLVKLQSGGKAQMAAMQLAGINAGQSQDKLAIAALDASSNTFIIGGTAAGSVASTQVASRVFVNTAYNKLSRLNVPTIGGNYVMVAHDDVINDLRADTNAGSWISVNQYQNSVEVMNNEIGMFSGFRVVRNNFATYADQTGTGTVDLYNCYFVGMNGLGKAVSAPVGLKVTGPFDKLGRIVNIGWYGVFAYSIVDTDAVWVGQCASSVGTNAS